MKLFDTKEKSAMGDDVKYSRAIKVPQYQPKETKPLIDSLVNYTKYSGMLKSINESNVSEEEKKFLRLAASRHIVFNYAKIADYYAHASKEMQELMETSALVILDVDDAIADGYVVLSKRMEALIDESKKARGKS